MKKNNTKNTIIGLVILAIVVLVIFILAVNTPKEAPESVKITAATKQLAKNYETDYPSTPRSVVTEYAEITRCFYASDTEESQIKDLATQMRQLFDDELVANQSFDDFYDSLISEIAVYRDKNKVVSSYSVSSSTDVKYAQNEYGSLATLYLSMNVREDGNINKIREQFVLRQDDAGHWKIYGWVPANDTAE
ncbi:MAG: hypothetical protein IJ075_02180 [Lachnospiraceae bacterium]|nr:hypothetical protein [Lachnospiraceae bacterium]MBQ9605795.1 hypothetical protein [Lachnospiraceae bacterium]MBR1522851.1 hypothetical protein [Lachnospiraceae bacterium]